MTDSICAAEEQWQKYLKEVRKDIPQDALDIYCGLHSGIPVCCVKFFIGPWKDYTNEQRKAYHKKGGKIMKEAGIKSWRIGFNYVPCPECQKNINIIHLKRCECSLAFHEIWGKHQISTVAIAVKYY